MIALSRYSLHLRHTVKELIPLDWQRHLILSCVQPCLDFIAAFQTTKLML